MKKTLLTLMVILGGLASASWGSTLTIINIYGGSSTQNVYNNSINSASFLANASSSQSISSGFKTVTGEQTNISLSVGSTADSRWNNDAITNAQDIAFTDSHGTSASLPSDDAKQFYSTINKSFEAGMTFTLGGFSSGTTLSQLSFGVGQGNWANNVSMKVSLTGVSFDTTGTDWVYSEANNTYTYTVGSSANTLTNLDIKNVTITDPNAVNIKLFGEKFDGNWSGLQGGLSYIAFETIPEPSTTTLSVLGLASLLLRRRRQA